MSEGLTPKQEAFSLAYVETGNASEAYRTAYDVGEDTKPETVWVEASKLLSSPKVALRIVDLQEAARSRNEITVDSLTLELELARSKAMADDKGASAAVSATMGKAKLHGLVTDKAEIAGKNGGPVQFQKIERVIVDPKN